MKQRKQFKKMVAGILLSAVVLTSIPVTEAFAMHGTSSEMITKDMLVKKAPTEYVIPKEMQAEASEGLYRKLFLKDSIQTTSITMDENNLNYLLQNAIDEPYVMTESVTIGEETIGYAGLKTKGNWTLWATNESESDRFSFTVNFGKFVTKKTHGAKQNFYGLKKVSFNNLFHDKTALKEYTALRLMDEMGVPTPEYGISKLYINGEYYGVYFMVEAMETSILERFYETDEISDYLYKLEDTSYIYDTALDAYKDEEGNFTMDSLQQVLYENEDGDYVAEGELLNSAAFWEFDSDTLQDVAEMLPTVLTWENKLNLLSQGKDFQGNDIDVNSKEYIALLNEIMDVEETLKYFATHSFIVQQDNMFSNYQNYAFYLDENGKSRIIPWDYDLAWGTYYDPMTAESVANNDLDNMYSQYFHGYKDMTTEEVYEKFPLVNVLFQNKKLWNKYYEYMEDCAKIATLGGETTDGRIFEAGRFSEIIDTLAPQLIEAAAEPMPEHVFYVNGYVQPEDMTLGIPNLKKLISMRSVGVWLQKNDVNSIVTGAGADLFALGNGATGKYSVSGTLTAVDVETGIFATANYPEEGCVGPQLDVEVLDAEHAIFQTIKDRLNVSDEDLIVYAMSNTKQPESLYELYIPVSSAFETNKTEVYEYSKDVLTLLKSKTDDKLYKVRTDDISYIAVANCKKADKGAVIKQDQKESKAKLHHRENTSYIVGKEDMSTIWWTAHSDHYDIPTNSTTVIEFENYSEEVNFWNNFALVFTNEAATYGLEQTLGHYQEYAVIRADDFGWGTLGQTLRYENTYGGDMSVFQEILRAANVTMTITRNSSTMTIHEVVTSMEDSAKSYERTVTFDAPKGVAYATLTVEGGYLKVNSMEQEKHDSYTVGKEDMSTTWWSEHSEHYELPAGSTTVVEFENHSAEVDIWDNFVTVFTNEAATYLEEQSADYQEYAVIRADDFGWGTAADTLTYTSSHGGDWEKLREILKDARVVMTITREGSKVTIHEAVTSMQDESMSYERTVTFDATEDDLFVSFTIEGGYLKMKQVENTIRIGCS